MTLCVNPVLLSHTRWISHLSAVTHIFSLIFSIFSHFRHLVNAARRFPELVLLPPGLLFQPARRSLAHCVASSLFPVRTPLRSTGERELTHQTEFFESCSEKRHGVRTRGPKEEYGLELCAGRARRSHQTNHHIRSSRHPARRAQVSFGL